MPIEERGRPLSLSERVDPKHTALIVIDMQNDFCHADGIIGSQGNDMSSMAPMAAKLQSLIVEARRLGVLTVFIRAHEDGRYLNDPMAESYYGRNFPDGLVRAGSWGADWYADIKPVGAPNEIEFIKHRFSAFGDSPLDLYLRSNGIRTIVTTGVVTSGCVDCSVRDGFALGYHCVIPSDCVADASSKRHDASLEKFAQAFGSVVPSEEILRAWQGKNSTSNNGEASQKHARGLHDLSAMLSPHHAALILVGLQEGAGFLTHPEIGRRIETLLAAARKAGVMILHIRASDDPLSRPSTGERQPGGAVRREQASDNALGALAPISGEDIVVSFRTSAFSDTRLDLLLRTNAVKTVVIAGFDITGAIESTARAARDRDYVVVIPDDAVAAQDGDEASAAHSLKILGKHFAKVMASAEVLSVWNAPVRP